jgi:hypothetical protein
MGNKEIAMKRTILCGLTLALCFTGGRVFAADVDQSNPKAAALSFAKALESGDSETAKSLVVGTDQEKQIVDATADFVSAVKKLKDSATKKFGDKATEITGQSMSVDMSKQIEGTESKEEGDTATLTNPQQAQGQQPMKLKKVDGKWKVDLSAITQGAAAGGQNVDQMQTTLKAWSGAFTEMANEIDQGKYETPEAARQAFTGKMMAALAAVKPPSTAPTTAPTTAQQ